MKKIDITPDLILRYIQGETNFEETVRILDECADDQFFRSWLDLETARIRKSSSSAKRENKKEIGIRYIPFPLVSLAAECDKDNLCSIKCELNILDRFGKAEGMNEENLSKEASELGLLKEQGTPLYNMGRLLSLHGLAVIRHYGSKIEDIINALEVQKCAVMVPVFGKKTFHAIVIQQIKRNVVSYYEPNEDKIATMVLPDFIAMWDRSNNYLVKVASKEAVRNTDLEIYHPDIISIPELTGRELEIEWAIAELYHDVWASRRLKEGWRYGDKRNDDQKIHPDLLPLAELKASEIQYDLDNAKWAVYMLTQVFGYDLVNKDDKERYCIEALKKMGYTIKK